MTKGLNQISGTLMIERVRNPKKQQILINKGVFRRSKVPHDSQALHKNDKFKLETEFVLTRNIYLRPDDLVKRFLRDQ